MYADDTQVYSSSRPENFTTLVKKFESCISHVKNWMIVNKLKMNEDKTELLHVQASPMLLTTCTLIVIRYCSLQKLKILVFILQNYNQPFGPNYAFRATLNRLTTTCVLFHSIKTRLQLTIWLTWTH